MALVGVAVGIALAAVTLEARDRWYPRPTTEAHLLYLTNGLVADRLSLSFDAVMADVYWVRAIQHYGRERKTARFGGRFDLLYPLLDVTTSLDPHFSIAYQFGALFLSEPQPLGPGRVDQAIALLEKGLRVEPTRWQYAHYIGFMNYWYTNDLAEAGRQFTRASEMPGAPFWLKPLAARMLAEGGDREAARTLLMELSRADIQWIRDLAARKLRELDEGGRR
jgi:tetratricopeptide (TPR) repeat protein